MAVFGGIQKKRNRDILQNSRKAFGAHRNFRALSFHTLGSPPQSDWGNRFVGDKCGNWARAGQQSNESDCNLDRGSEYIQWGGRVIVPF